MGGGREASERSQLAACGLHDRIAEIEAQEAVIDQLDAKLIELTDRLVEIPAVAHGSQAEPILKTA